MFPGKCPGVFRIFGKLIPWVGTAPRRDLERIGNAPKCPMPDVPMTSFFGFKIGIGAMVEDGGWILETGHWMVGRLPGTGGGGVDTHSFSGNDYRPFPGEDGGG